MRLFHPDGNILAMQSYEKKNILHDQTWHKSLCARDHHGEQLLATDYFEVVSRFVGIVCSLPPIHLVTLTGFFWRRCGMIGYLAYVLYVTLA